MDEACHGHANIPNPVAHVGLCQSLLDQRLNWRTSPPQFKSLLSDAVNVGLDGWIHGVPLR